MDYMILKRSQFLSKQKPIEQKCLLSCLFFIFQTNLQKSDFVNHITVVDFACFSGACAVDASLLLLQHISVRDICANMGLFF